MNRNKQTHPWSVALRGAIKLKEAREKGRRLRAQINQKEKQMNIKCYDNGGKTIDRYTVVFLDYPERQAGMYMALGMNAEPFHPQGFGQHCTAMVGPHLGKRIEFNLLPVDCRKLVLSNLEPVTQPESKGETK